MPVVELRVDRNLVCTNFDGYKLSFDPVPVLREELDSAPSRLEPIWIEYSRLHGEVFNLHNHLYADPWIRHNTYFVNAHHEVMQCIYDPQIGSSLGLRVVYTIEQKDHGDGYAQLPGDYNYTMCFVSERFCVICDGITTYHLLDTGDRSRPSLDQWQLVTRAPVDKESGKRGYHMYDARLDVVQERKQISVVAGRVRGRFNEPLSACFMELAWGHWVFNLLTNEWEYTIRERLVTDGSVNYCAFEPRAESLIVASNRKIQTHAQRDAAEAAAAAAAEVAAAATAAAGTPPPPTSPFVLPEDNAPVAHGTLGTYTWHQTNKEVFFHFPLPENATEADITIRNTSTTLEVIYLEQVLMSSELCLPVLAESMTFTVGQRALHIILDKETPNHRWPRALKHDDDAVDHHHGTPPRAAPLPIANLEDPIEECDLGNLDDDFQMMRFNLPQKKITHTIFLGTLPLVFVTNLRPGFPPAFVTRHGVDASVWLQVYQPSRPDEWSVRHVGQLHAFAYVQASKESRKFTACCPDFEYSVICESRRNVLIYHTRHDSAGGLRKRNGPPVTIGKQNLVNIDIEHGDIMGITTANNVITILTEGALLHLQL